MDEDYIRELTKERDRIRKIRERNDTLFTWLIFLGTTGATAILGFWWVK